MHRPIRQRRGRKPPERGQTLAEFAIVLPVLMLIVLIGIDFGRAFFSWVTLTNAARIAANYAATNPNEAYPSAAYTTLVTNDAANALTTVCPISGTFNPTFIDGPDANATTRDLGDSVQVSITCNFAVLTPIIGAIVGSPLPIGANAVFPMRTGAFQQ